MAKDIQRNPTRSVRVGSVLIGQEHDNPVQTMTATHTQEIDETLSQIADMLSAGADIIRVACDNNKDARALAEIRKGTDANLVVDLQENYRLVTEVAPNVEKVRYNPGHLYHVEKNKPVREKVEFIAAVAAENDCALRVGVNCGSVDPLYAEKYPEDGIEAMVRCAVDHCAYLDEFGFTRYVVSLKDSDPGKVVRANHLFAGERPDGPLHLGGTEAGLPPDGIIKTRIAFDQLITVGIGDTIRVSLTLPNDRKAEEDEAGHRIIKDIRAGRIRAVPEHWGEGLNIIACPSCSRVENMAFIDLAEQVKEMSVYAEEHNLTIAVMGCRVNGPGETDDADLGLWCGPRTVNLKKKSEPLGSYTYDEVLDRLREELDRLIAART